MQMTEDTAWKQWVKTASGRVMSRNKQHGCPCCGQPFVQGQKIFPADHGAWAHLQCVMNAETGKPRIPWCKHGRNCRHPNCFFRHPDGEGDATNQDTQPRNVLKSSRAATVRRWMVHTFGAHRLSQGTGVMEVAAGKGMLSFELINVDGIPAFAFEPRSLDLERVQRRFRMGFYKRRSDSSLMDAKEHSSSVVPFHIRSLFSYEANDEAAKWPLGLEDESAFHCAKERGLRMVQRHNSDNHHLSLVELERLPVDPPNEHAPQIHGGRVVNDLAEARRLVDASSIVVGIHPDEATEAIVDFALASRKPFVVVPCCVHGRSFPERRIEENGQQVWVHSYEQFLRYLQQKHAGIQRHELPFQGRSTVLYHQGTYA